jgi:hypothetical protein
VFGHGRVETTQIYLEATLAVHRGESTCEGIPAAWKSAGAKNLATDCSSSCIEGGYYLFISDDGINAVFILSPGELLYSV